MGELRVAAAAILLDGRIHTLPPPARHHDIIGVMAQEFDPEGEPGARSWHLPGSADQGFLLSDGRFASRRAAEQVARAAGQLTGDLIGSVLTTEDLW